MNTVLLSPSDANSGAAKSLQQSGARVITWPELVIDHPENYLALDEAIANLFGYDWLILKNDRAAKFFLQRFKLHHEPAELDDLKIVSVGGNANQAFAESPIHVDLPLDRSQSANLFASLRSFVGDLGGVNILLPSANAGREVFEEQLMDAGARVDNVTAYRTVSDPQELAQMSALLVGGGIDSVVFTSPDSVREFAEVTDTNDLGHVLRDTTVGCVGVNTSVAAADFGLSDPVVLTGMQKEDVEKLLNRL